MRTLVSISPTFPPEACGVSDYSWQLTQRWPDKDVVFAFLVARLPRTGELGALNGPFAFGSSFKQLSYGLRRAVGSTVILHYAGGGYGRWGCPIWLAMAFRAWKRSMARGHFMVFFHEVPPQNLPPLSRHYLPNWINQKVVTMLCRMADCVVTNTSGHAAQLKKLSGLDHIDWIPVPSTIASTMSFEQVQQRQAGSIVVFGLPFNRLQVLRQFQGKLRQWVSEGRCTAIHLVGPREGRHGAQEDMELDQMGLKSTSIAHGHMAKQEICRLLRSCEFGLVIATEENFSKSTTFMALAENRCPIVVQVPGKQTPFDQTISVEEVSKFTPEMWNKVSGERAVSLAKWCETHARWDTVAKKLSCILEQAMARNG